MTSVDQPSPPDTLEDLLSPEWLTDALAPRFPGLRVTEVTRGPVVSRVSTNARFRISCDGGLPDGLSADLCLKGYFGDAGRASRQAGIPEVGFYRELAPRAGVRTLTPVYAHIDATTQHGVVITEDVVAQGATFLDPRSDYTPDQTAESLEQLATLHAAMWGDAQCAAADWLASRLASTLQARGVPEIRGNFEGPIGAGVPSSVRDPQRLVDAYRSLAAEVIRGTPWTVVHGDADVGNLYLDGAGRPSLIDWQLVQRGMWYLDVGYHIASTLTIADRRTSEWDLLRHYLARLAAAGVDVPTWDAACTGLRRGIIHGFFLWGITLKVEPAVTAVLLERLGTAAADLEAFAATD